MFRPAVDRTADGADDLATGDHRSIFQRKRGGAEGAFRHRPPDIPMGAPATRAMIGLIIAIHDMITARADFGNHAARVGFENMGRHYSAPSKQVGEDNVEGLGMVSLRGDERAARRRTELL